MAKKINEEETRQQNVAEAVSKTEQFFKENGKLIYGCVISILVIALVALAYVRFYLQPKKAEAQKELFHAEQWFTQGEYELALAGDGNYLGLEEVIDTYGAKAGAAVYLYAGVSKLQLGQYEEALAYLNKYNGKDAILRGRANACIGDAYVGLEQYKEALAAYLKAAEVSDNLFAADYLLKAGQVAETLGDNAQAVALYKQIKDQYPQAVEAMDIDKYITRIEK